MPTTVSASFTRPANTTAYTAADLVANSATAGDVVAPALSAAQLIGQGTITRLGLYKSGPTATAAKFNVHLFTEPPVVTNGDNGALAIDTAANHIGSVACDMSTGGLAGTAGLSKHFAITGGITFKLPNSDRRLYALIEATDAYTPASEELFRVTLEIQNGM